MARTHRAYPPEFRQQTVDLDRSRRTPDELARGCELLEQIKTIWQPNREAHGRPRSHTEPLPADERVSPKRVGRLMRGVGICVQAPNQADKRSRAPTHEPCTGQEILQAGAGPPPGTP